MELYFDKHSDEVHLLTESNGDLSLFYKDNKLNCFIECQFSYSRSDKGSRYIYLRPDEEHRREAWKAAIFLHKKGWSIDFIYKDVIIELGNNYSFDFNNEFTILLANKQYIEYKASTKDRQHRVMNEFKYP